MWWSAPVAAFGWGITCGAPSFRDVSQFMCQQRHTQTQPGNDGEAGRGCAPQRSKRDRDTACKTGRDSKHSIYTIPMTGVYLHAYLYLRMNTTAKYEPPNNKDHNGLPPESRPSSPPPRGGEGPRGSAHALAKAAKSASCQAQLFKASGLKKLLPPPKKKNAAPLLRFFFIGFVVFISWWVCA